MFTKRNWTAFSLLSLMVWALFVPGCSAFGSKKQVQQLEMENNRLLSEFRAERQRRETAEKTAQQLEMRLSESEKMLARQIQTTPPNRLSSLPASPYRPGAPPAFNQDPSGGLSDLGGDGEYRWQRRVK